MPKAPTATSRPAAHRERDLKKLRRLRTPPSPAGSPWPRASTTPWACSPRPPDLLRSSSLPTGRDRAVQETDPARPRDPRMRSGRHRRPGSAMPPPAAILAVVPSRRHGRPHWPPAREGPGPHLRPGHQTVPPDRQEPALRLAGYTARLSRTPGQGAAAHRPQPSHLPDSYRPFAAGIFVYAKRVIVDD